MYLYLLISTGRTGWRGSGIWGVMKLSPDAQKISILDPGDENVRGEIHGRPVRQKLNRRNLPTFHQECLSTDQVRDQKVAENHEVLLLQPISKRTGHRRSRD